MKKIFTLVGLLFLCVQSHSQDTGEEKLGTWLSYFGTHRVTDKFSIYTELELNLYEIASNYNQFWGIAAFNYHIKDNFVASVGYGYFNYDPTFSDVPGEKNTIDNTLFEQFTTNYSIGKMQVQNRYRLEQRFIHIPADDVVRHRLRARIQLTYPLSKTWFVVGQDEVFLNFREPVFNQNRAVAALGYRFTPNANLQLGYMKNHNVGTAYDRLLLTLVVNTNLRKKEKEPKP